MTQKHIACLVILFFCIVIAQGISMLNRRTNDMKAGAAKAQRDAEIAASSARSQRLILDDLGRKSADLLDYLKTWEPHLSRLSTPESVEINLNALIKESGLILLAQRFEVTPNKTGGAVPSAADATIPQIVRAHLTIEDDFVKSVNWLGDLESKLPSARVSNLQLARGQNGNDVRLALIVDVPLARPSASPAPPKS
jgi:hypothetical protein